MAAIAWKRLEGKRRTINRFSWFRFKRYSEQQEYVELFCLDTLSSGMPYIEHKWVAISKLQPLKEGA